MNKAEKRGDKWRIQVYDFTDEDGKKHKRSFTADTKAEVEYMAAEFLKEKRHRTSKVTKDWTVGSAIDRYISLREGLSPTTLSSYDKIKRYAFQDIMNMKVSRIDDLVMQDAINKEAKRISSTTGKQISTKTLKNEVGLLLSALRIVCKREYQIAKIEQQKHIKEYPNPKDVIKAIQGTDIELPCMLAIWLTFTMSEIRGLKCSDIKNGYITINRVKVEVNSQDVVKDDAKVQTRLRKHQLPDYIMNLIETFPYYKEGSDDFLIPWSRDKIYGRWRTICKENNLGDLSFHDLRHMSASIMSYLRISQRCAEQRGGWAKGSSVLPRVYTESFDEERIEADAKINAYFNEALSEKFPKKVPQEKHLIRKPLKNKRFKAVN